MIEVPAKIWRLKVISKYTTPNLDNKDIDDILDYGQYGKCVYKTDFDWSDDFKSVDIITYNKAIRDAKLEKDLNSDESVDGSGNDSQESVESGKSSEEGFNMSMWEDFLKKYNMMA